MSFTKILPGHCTVSSSMCFVIKLTAPAGAGLYHVLYKQIYFFKRCKRVSSDSLTAEKNSLKTQKHPHIQYTLPTVHADTKKTAAHAQTGTERHHQLQRQEVGPFLGFFLVHTWPQINLRSFSKLIVYQCAGTQHTRRPQDEPHIGAISCTSTVLADTSAPWTDAFKDSGWLLGAPERSLVKITETWSKIDSLEELQIDIMCLIIAYST